MAIDYTQMSLEQLDALAAQEKAKAQPSGFSNFAAEAGNRAVAASRGVATGLRDAGRDAMLLSRDLLDKTPLGTLTGGAEVTEQVRKRYAEADRQSLSIDKHRQEYEGTYDFANSATKLLAEMTALNGLGGLAAKAVGVAAPVVGGAGKVALEAGKGALNFGATQALQDPGTGNLASRLEDVPQAMAMGAALGGVPVLAGNALGKASDAATKAFEKLGVKPRLSQILESEMGQRTAGAIEKTLSYIPGMGMKRSANKQAAAYNDAARSIAKDVEAAKANGDVISQKFKTVFETAKNSDKPFPLINARKALEEVAKDSSLSNPMGKLSKNFTDQLERYQQTVSAPRGLKTAHESRIVLDDMIDTLKEDVGGTRGMELKALYKLRKGIEKDVTTLADMTGNKSLYESTKKEFQNYLGAKDLSEVFAKGITSAQRVKPITLQHALEKFRLEDDTYKLLTPELKSAAKALEYVGDKIITGSVKTQVGTALGPFLVGTGLVAGGTAALGTNTMDGETVAALGGLGVGISLMLRSPTGIKLLTKAGRAGKGSHLLNDILRTGTRLGAAALTISQSPGEARPLTVDDYSKLSLEELDALAEREKKGK